MVLITKEEGLIKDAFRVKIFWVNTLRVKEGSSFPEGRGLMRRGRLLKRKDVISVHNFQPYLVYSSAYLCFGKNFT